ncbi:MAG: anti-sigma factor domain-containing protein [Fimbriiglobus sp.]
MSSPANIERLYDLLAQEAISGITAAEQIELDHLLQKWPHVGRAEVSDTVAALDLHWSQAEELPPELRAKLAAQATPIVEAHIPRPSRKAPWKPLALAGWGLALSLLVAVGYWQVRSAATLDLNQRQAALASRADSTRFVSQPGATTANVVWNQASQEGYLQVRGLPANDPTRMQYQLWIIDAGRGQPGQSDANNRVDGGVFDVAPDGTALIPIRAAVKVFNTQAFAITEEAPGGVIVSRAKENLKVLLVKE